MPALISTHCEGAGGCNSERGSSKCRASEVSYLRTGQEGQENCFMLLISNGTAEFEVVELGSRARDSGGSQ